MNDQEKIDLLRNALAKLIWECETNYIFGEDIEEEKALNDAHEAMSLTEV